MFAIILHLYGKDITYSARYETWSAANRWIKEHVKESGYHLYTIVEIAA